VALAAVASETAKVLVLRGGLNTLGDNRDTEIPGQGDHTTDYHTAGVVATNPVGE
jgi:hypothetical protein